jgi:hypothetical protein
MLAVVVQVDTALLTSLALLLELLTQLLSAQAAQVD